MKNGVNNYLHKAYVVCVILVTVAFVGCGNDPKGHDYNDMNKQDTTIDQSIVRTGVIDLQMIDLNKDGNVYQDPMDWNVISDESGKCPLCEMELKEVTLQEAKENLIKNDFKVKDN
jgi:Cu(I)/Ag(I) efflux system membrane fusion protein/cobalt-zinc-cadmium efflux system membrane fusion protein